MPHYLQQGTASRDICTKSTPAASFVPHKKLTVIFLHGKRIQRKYGALYNGSDLMGLTLREGMGSLEISQETPPAFLTQVEVSRFCSAQGAWYWYKRWKDGTLHRVPEP